MFPALASTVVATLLFGPPAVLSKFNTISFSSVQQCGSFNVHFSGGQAPAALPLLLTVVPFTSSFLLSNSSPATTPLSIELPANAWNDQTATGAMVTFLPFQQETEFIASLDDANGNPTGLVSDIIRVQPSGNTTCLSPPPSTDSAVQTSRYTLQDPAGLSQCKPFAVLFDPTVAPTPPTIRTFIPRNISFLANYTSVDTPGKAEYLMQAAKNQQVVMMFSDETGYKQGSGLFGIGGNVASSSDCLDFSSANQTNAQPTSSKSNPGSLSKPAIIAIGVSVGGIVGSIAIIMTIWLHCEKRKTARRSIKQLEEAKGSLDFLPDLKRDGGVSDRLTEKPSTFNSAPPLRGQESFSRLRPMLLQKEQVATTTPLASPPFAQISRKASGALQHNNEDLTRYGNFQNPPYITSNLGVANTAANGDGLSNTFTNISNGPEVTNASEIMSLAPSTTRSIPIPLNTPTPMTFGSKEPMPRFTLVTPGSDAQSVHPSVDGHGGHSRTTSTRSHPTSMTSDDIDHILEMATIYSPALSPGFGRNVGRSSQVSYRYTSSPVPQRSRPSPSPSTMLSTPSTAYGGVVTPNSAMTYRDPPQAILPTSPNPGSVIDSVSEDTDGEQGQVIETISPSDRVVILPLRDPPPARLPTNRR
ncbi:hypothetical protein ABKN59_010341 [Abortiporus biennis]